MAVEAWYDPDDDDPISILATADVDALRETYLRLNPAAIRREILALSAALAREVTAKDLPHPPLRGTVRRGHPG